MWYKRRERTWRQKYLWTESYRRWKARGRACEDDKIFEPKLVQDDLKILTIEGEYNTLVGDQESEAITWIIDDMKEESEDEYVKEVNIYEVNIYEP